MTGIQLPNLGLTGDIPDHATWGTEGRANDRRLDSLIMPAVKSALNTPPVSPADGDRYLVGTAPIGAWATQPNSIAVWESAAAGWTFYAPKPGWTVYDEATDTRMLFNGTWEEDSSGGGTVGTNVKKYGAVGDGVTNDSAAVLAAIVAAPAGSRLYFPAGTYLLSTWSVSTLTKRLWVCGDGMGVSIIKAALTTSFLSIRANFRCSDITFDTWLNVLDFSALTVADNGATGVLDQVLIEDTEINNYGRAIFASAPTTTGSPAVGFRKLRVSRCNFFNGSDGPSHDRGGYPIFISTPVQDDIQVLNCNSKTSIARGINLGNNSLVFEPTRAEYQILGNSIEDVTAIHPAGAEGIIVYGSRAIISDNFVKNVWKTTDEGTPDEDATDANGIYTKCRFTNISDNVLIDAGQAEGFIDVKGYARTDVNLPAAQRPFGYGCVVSNNILIDTQVNPTAVGGGRRTLGIKLATSEAMVVGNYIEGMTSIGIYTESGESNNHLIADNMIRNIRGQAGIECFGGGDHIRVINNTIDTVLGTYAPTTPYGIKMDKNGGGNVDVAGNRIRNIGCREVTVGVDNVFTTVQPTTLATPHGFLVDETVKFFSSGTLPSPLLAATTYYVISTPTPTTFKVSTTLGGAELDITDIGAGRLTARRATAGAGIQISPGSFNKELNSATAGVIDAATDTLTVTAPHALRVNDRVQFISTGTLPSPLHLDAPGTWYYIKTLPTAATVTISATLGGATLDITDVGSGVHTMQRETITRGWRIADNHVDGAFYAIQFTYPETLVTLDDVLVRHNTWRNIDPGTVTNGDEVQYSDAPTNLVDLPAEMPSGLIQTGFVPDIWELKNGSVIQDLHLYGNGDGLTPSVNYERLSVRMDASKAWIDVQAGGTGVIEDLYFGFNGVGFWRLPPSGHFQPLANNLYDLGTTLMRVRNAYVGKDLFVNGADARVYVDYTNSATIGNVTIHKISGRVNVAATATAVVVGNNRVTANSHVLAQIAQVDANAPRITSVVPGAGTFTITVTPAPAANMAIDFFVLSTD